MLDVKQQQQQAIQIQIEKIHRMAQKRAVRSCFLMQVMCFHEDFMQVEWSLKKKEKVKKKRRKNLVGLVKHDVSVIHNEFYKLIQKYCCVRRNDFREFTSTKGYNRKF